MHPSCSPECRPASPESRTGRRIEDGAAHTRDHLAWSRRDFFLRMGMGLAGASFMMSRQPVSVFGHSPLLGALSRAATNRVLVLIQLNGGNDALNTIVPYEIDEYYRVRPHIAVPKGSVLRLENDHGMNPSMQSMVPLWNDNALAVVLNAGYNNSTRSHFEGTVNWATGTGQTFEAGGQTYTSGVWGRYLEDVIEDRGGILEHPLAVRIGGPVSLFQSGLGNLGVSLGDSSFIEEIARRGFYNANDERVAGKAYGRPLNYVRAVANSSLKFVGSVQRAAQAGTNLAGNYPGGFGANLAAAARLIRGNLGAQVVSVSKGGFDTHSNQGSTEGTHAGHWREIADAVAAFYQDLAVDGLDERVLVMTYSEFGRTLGENGSRGTDHGAGASMMLYGPGLNRGVYGSQSDLITQLYGGDPAPTTDYRSVYASLLQDWFGVPAGDVDALLGASFPRLDLVQDKTTVASESTGVPDRFVLDQNYPNPFNPVTTIAFTLGTAGDVLLEVFDVQGRRVRVPLNRPLQAGRHELMVSADGLPSGTYLYRLTTSEGTQTRQMVLLK